MAFVLLGFVVAQITAFTNSTWYGVSGISWLVAG